MNVSIYGIVLLLALGYGQTPEGRTDNSIVLPNSKILRCKSADCSQVWSGRNESADAIFPKQVIFDINQGCVYGMTALYDKSVPLDEIKAAIDERYGKWAVSELTNAPVKAWRVEAEKFAIQLSIASKSDEKRVVAEAGTRQAIYLAFGGKSACTIP
jgi:hypothetical protein